MTEEYRVKKEYDDTHQMYFYYPEVKVNFLWTSFWAPLDGPRCLFAREDKAVEYIEKYKSGEIHSTEYKYL